MSREKDGCREIYAELFAKYGTATIKKTEAARLLGFSPATMTRTISAGKLTATGQFVSLWQIAKFLVG